MATQEDISLVLALRKELEIINNEIATTKANGDQALSFPEQFSGRALPARIGEEIDFDGTLRRHQANIIVSSDGPFYASSIFFCFRFTDENNQYRLTWRNISSINDLYLTTPSLNFYWEYHVTGSERKRQNIPVPSAIISRSETGNGYFPLIPNDVFEAEHTVIVYITPTQNLNTFMENFSNETGTGRLWVGFNGFYCLD